MLELLNEHQRSIHNRAVYLSRRHRALEAELIATLRLVDEEQIHKRLQYTSLVKYAVDALGLNEAVAVAFVTVAKKSAQVAELAGAIRKGEVSVSTASRLTSVISDENARELVEFAKKHTHREINLKVASINPRANRRAHVKAVAGDRVRLSVDLPLAVLEKIERAQDLLSIGKPCDKETAIETVFTDWLESSDPVKKAERAQVREFKRAARLESRRLQHAIEAEHMQSKTACNFEARGRKAEQADKSCSNKLFNQVEVAPVLDMTRKSPFGAYVKTRVPIPAKTKHPVALRDQCRCTFIDSQGRRCEGRRGLHIHHIRPVSCGGTNALENLTTICSVHHEFIHQLSLPIDGQVSWIREPVRAYVV